ncbi:fimbrial protein [Novosphingobium sp.]|uniref:fimbrial protein n=1 Tax=Novosphingobium sp. TaxID=1874826 RepID=UPI003B52DB49
MPARLIRRLLFALLFAGLMAGMTAAPASALTVSLSAPSLQFTPAGPYNAARNAPVGTILATATSTLNVSGLSGTCAMTAVFLSNSATSSGNTFATGLAGIGVNFYYVVGGTQTQIDPGIQASVLLNPATPGPVTILAQLVVTGPVSAGSLSALPSLGIVFVGVGLGCGVLNVTTQTLAVTASAATVTGTTCTVPTPTLTINLPTVSVQSLSAAGQTGGAVNFSVLLNCSGTGAGIYVTLTDANLVSNTTSLLTLSPASTATNVKLQVLNSSGAPVSYGPDSANAGNIGQWYVGPSASLSSIPLIAQYYATGPAGPGSVFALATFTLSYQ